MTLVTRETRETKVTVELTRQAGAATIATTIPFLDHMLATFARYSGLGLRVEAAGDLRHHILEDVAIAMGDAVRGLAGSSIARYGERTVPMDDALVQCVIDVGGRAFYRGPLPSMLYDHWIRSFAENAKATVHIRVLRGTDRHHVVEAAFKALGLSLRDALLESGGVFSTKGAVNLARSS